jgi:uncharacterized protein YjdB
MAEYKSRYTGEQIDAGIAKANTALQEHQDLSSKQDKLVSGTTIKTINGNSILGEGNLVIEGGGEGLSSVAHDNTLTGAGTNANPLGVDSSKFQSPLVSGINIKTINNTSILGNGNIDIPGGGGGDSFLTEETISSGGDVAVTGLELDLYTYNAIVGGSFYINPIVLPTNATDKAVSWSSSDSTIATVNEQGQVNAIATGTSNIICTTHDGGFTATCVVAVSEGTIIPVDSVSLNKATTSLQVGNTETLTATVLPANATDKTLTWSTSDSSKATINNGVVTAVASGTATITATSNADNTKYDTCEITITSAPTPAQKIQLSTLERTPGGIKADGTPHTLGGVYHTIVPYTEGIEIKTTWNGNWDLTKYPAVLVENNGTYTPIVCSIGDKNISIGGKIAKSASATLTGYSTGSSVIINMLIGSATTTAMDDTDSLYYIEGSNE